MDRDLEPGTGTWTRYITLPPLYLSFFANLNDPTHFLQNCEKNNKNNRKIQICNKITKVEKKNKNKEYRNVKIEII